MTTGVAPFSGSLASTVAIGGGISGTSTGGGAQGSLGIINAAERGAKTDGTATASTINGIITNIIAGTKQTLYFSPGVYGLEANVTIPANVRLWIAKGATFKGLAAGLTLSVQGEMDAVEDQIFDMSAFSFAVVIAKRNGVLPEWWGAVGDDVNADDLPIQRCINIGNDVRFRANATYRLTGSGLNVFTTGQTLHLNGATFHFTSATATGFKIGSSSGGAFSKADFVTLEGPAVGIGADNGAGTSVSCFVDIIPPLTNPYVEGGGCSHTTISNIRESGFTIGVRATAADNLSLSQCRFGGNFYHSALGAGGYGTVLQTCFQIRVVNNDFVASATDRHGVYFSGDPNRAFDDNNVCKGAVCTDNTFDWRGVNGVGPTGFEAPCEIRSAWKITVSDNTFLGGYGAIDYGADNGNGKGVVFANNIFDGQIAGASTRGCITITRASGTNITDTVTINGNTFRPTGANTYAIIAAFVNNLAIQGNSGVTNGSIAMIGIAGSVVGFCESGNTWDFSNGYCYEMAGAGNTDFQFGVSTWKIRAGGTKWHWFTFPSPMRFGWVRSARVNSNGAGGFSIVQDPDGIITSVASNVAGMDVTLHGSVDLPDFTRTLASAGLGSVNVGRVNTNAFNVSIVTFGVGGVAAGLPAIPAATNAYELVVRTLT